MSHPAADTFVVPEHQGDDPAAIPDSHLTAFFQTSNSVDDGMPGGVEKRGAHTDVRTHNTLHGETDEIDTRSRDAQPE